MDLQKEIKAKIHSYSDQSKDAHRFPNSNGENSWKTNACGPSEKTPWFETPTLAVCAGDTGRLRSLALEPNLWGTGLTAVAHQYPPGFSTWQLPNPQGAAAGRALLSSCVLLPRAPDAALAVKCPLQSHGACVATRRSAHTPCENGQFWG